MGGAFGGKQSGEVEVEAARLARAANATVRVAWSREEEFTASYHRPAGVVEPCGARAAHEQRRGMAGARVGDDIGGAIDRDSSVWVSYMVMGGILFLAGLFCMRKRHTPQPEATS